MCWPVKRSKSLQCLRKRTRKSKHALLLTHSLTHPLTQSLHGYARTQASQIAYSVRTHMHTQYIEESFGAIICNSRGLHSGTEEQMCAIMCYSQCLHRRAIMRNYAPYAMFAFKHRRATSLLFLPPMTRHSMPGDQESW